MSTNAAAELLTYPQFAAENRVSVDTVKVWVAEGRIKPSNPPRNAQPEAVLNPMIRRSELAKIQEWNTNPTGPPVRFPLQCGAPFARSTEAKPATVGRSKVATAGFDKP